MNSPDDYEVLVKGIIEGLPAPAGAFTEIGQGRANCLEGQSGVAHQIDVSFVYKARQLVIVECKEFSDENVGLLYLRALKATADDIQGGRPDLIVSAVMVSNGPLQRGAKTFADYYKIGHEQVVDRQRFAFRWDKYLSLGIAVQAGPAKAHGVAQRIITGDGNPQAQASRVCGTDDG